jgi:hypothetical protein
MTNRAPGVNLRIFSGKRSAASSRSEASLAAAPVLARSTSTTLNNSLSGSSAK